MAVRNGCHGCIYSQWDSDGCTCMIDGLLVWNPAKGCKYRKPENYEQQAQAEIMIRYDDLLRYCENRHCGCVPIEYIKQMQTIKIEPVRHGRWIPDHNGIIVCTLCRYPRQIGAKDFCGKCGARMDGDADNG